MYVAIKHSGCMVSVLDTKDGVVENFHLGTVVRSLIKEKHINIVGIEVRPEFGDGQDVFLNFDKSRRALQHECDGKYAHYLQ